MSLAAQTFSSISPERFAALAEKVKQETGIEIACNVGAASSNGYTLSWTFAPESEQLVIELMHKPMFVPASMVMGKIRELVEQS